jgi:hypothetical protein
MCVVDRAAGDGFQFADEIGGAKSAVRSVGMVVAEAVGLWSGGKGAAASISKAESASGEIGSGVREEPFGGLRVDIPRRMSNALASHGESLAK